MTKYTAAGVEAALDSTLTSFRTRAAALKAKYHADREALLSDARLSQEAKNGDRTKLLETTAQALTELRDQQIREVEALRASVEKQLRGNQPVDASSIMLRRDAAERTRRISDEGEALEMFGDAVRMGDESLAHSIGYRARQSGWVDVLDAYRKAHPGSADLASALAFVEDATTNNGAYNLSNSITFNPPLDS